METFKCHIRLNTYNIIEFIIVKRIYLVIIALIVCISLFQEAKAQRRDWSGPWSIGVGFGPNHYIGDFNEHNDNRVLILPQSLGFSGHGFFSKGVGPFEFVLQMNVGRLLSRDYVKDEMFRNNFYDYGMRFRLNFNHLIGGRRYIEGNWHFFGELGYGFLRYSAYRTNIPNDILYDQVGYARIAKSRSITLGTGIQYNFTNEASFIIAANYHFLNQDDIDAKVAGSNNDAYLYLSVGFKYAFSDFGVKRGRSRSLRWGRF